MSNSNNHTLLKLKPMGYFELTIITLLTLLLAGLLFLIGSMGPVMTDYFFYPIAGLVVIGLVVFDIIKIKTIRAGSVETITFTKDGIHFENKIVGLRELVKWFSVVDIFVTKIDEDDDQENEQKDPNKVVILTPHNEEYFFLSDYETIFTNRKVIWERIREVHSACQPNT